MTRDGKILITVPALTARGGITNYYHVLRNEFSLNVEYFERGARTWPIRKGFISELFRAWGDYVAFKQRLEQNDIAVVQTSTSLGIYTTIRDGLFLRFARRKGLKTIVFFRGWDLNTEKKTKKYLWLFKYFFFKSTCIITLSQHTKDCLAQWGYNGNIHLETTLVDRILIEKVNYEALRRKYQFIKQREQINLLFLSRVEKKKGIYELLDAFKRIKNSHQNYIVKLNICGDGFELENIKKIIEEEKIADVTISGFVEGEQKIRAYEEADIFVFPSYSEGMPNAILEAMGFGLPIITTMVGGVKDFFETGKNGLFIEVGDSRDIEIKILQMIHLGAELATISASNFEKANHQFRSDVVARRVETIFRHIK